MEFNKEHGVVVIYDKVGKVKLVYSAPVLFLASNKTTTVGLDWDAASSSISFTLPDFSLPFVIAFGLSSKLPDVKGGFHLAFPSFKFGGKGEVEVSDSESSEDDGKDGGLNLNVKVPKFGFGKGEKGDKGKFKVFTYQNNIFIDSNFL